MQAKEETRTMPLAEVLAKITPLPWHYEAGELPGPKANAAYLAHAANVLPGLVEALDTLTLVIGLTPIAGNRGALREAVNGARTAIAQTVEVP